MIKADELGAAQCAHDSPRHREKLLEQPLPQRLGSLITPELVEFATSTAARFGTSDVVVILDSSSPSPELIGERRIVMASSSQLPDGLRAKLTKPASEVAKRFHAPQTSFWLLAIHSDDEMDCVAVNASMLCAGGTA